MTTTLLSATDDRYSRTYLRGRLTPTVLLALIMVAACGHPGTQFAGKWVNTKDPRDTMNITRNGDQFLVESRGNRVGAVYKDGSLEVSGIIGSVRITHVKDSDTLIAPGLLGQAEYVRQDSKAAVQAAYDRQERQEADRQRQELERQEQQRAADARQAAYEKERAQQQQTEENKRLYTLRFEALRRKAYDDGLPPLTKAADRGYALAQNELGWFYATSPDRKYLDPAKAVRFALAAVQQEPSNWSFADTLAAAYGRAGDFKQALELQQRAIDLLRENSQVSTGDRERLLSEAKERLALYTRQEAFSQK